jgi:hypothetical protein
VFHHNLLPIEELVDETVDGTRYYLTPVGRVPSVTTVIGAHKGDSWLKEWKDKVGVDQANAITRKAKVRGRAFHEICEKYVMNDPDWSDEAMPSNLYAFQGIQKILDSRVGTVYGVEYPLWSGTLMTAGRTDLVADFDGVPSVIDFKTSLRNKDEEAISGYLIQKTCYSMMLEERQGFRAEQVVTLMAVDHESPLVWVRDRQDYVAELVNIFVTNRSIF